MKKRIEYVCIFIFDERKNHGKHKKRVKPIQIISN